MSAGTNVTAKLCSVLKVWISDAVIYDYYYSNYYIDSDKKQLNIVKLVTFEMSLRKKPIIFVEEPEERLLFLERVIIYFILTM